MNQLTDTEAGKSFVRAISKLRTPEEIEQFLNDIWSPAEIKNVCNRWQALVLLQKKENYLDIQKQTGLSSATIAKMSTSLKYGSGMVKSVLERMS